MKNDIIFFKNIFHQNLQVPRKNSQRILKFHSKFLLQERRITVFLFVFKMPRNKTAL